MITRMNPKTIKCPNCKEEISIDKVLTHQIETTIKLELEQKTKAEKLELEQKAKADLDEVRRKAKEWQEAEAKKYQEKEKELEEKQRLNQQKLEESLKKKILEESEQEQKMLKDELELKKKQIQEAREKELNFIKKQELIEERERNLELELKKQLAEERAKISEMAEKRVKDEYQLDMAAKDKLAQDLLKQIEDLKQKATQGSQQMQGEMLELELEQILKSEFPIDDISPVGKGINGADILQKVRDSNGKECGVIIWETKRTKNWDEKWVPKLKDDMRSAKSDLAILVTTAMPQGLINFGHRDGVYVTNYENYLAIAKIMRMKIIELFYAKMAGEGVNDKKQILWQYLTGNEFKQRVETIVEAFNSMKTVMDKEKQYFTKKWAQEEKLIDRVINQTIGMHGDLQGLMGASLPEIKSLEMDNFELIEDTHIHITNDTTTVVQTSISSGTLEES